MLRNLLALLVVFSFAVPGLMAAEEGEAVPALLTLNVKPTEAAFDNATANKPIELTSEDDAKKYFTAEQIKDLGKSVDWTKQKVLVFAWRGSGGDKHSGTVVEEDDKSTIVFSCKRGFTRDLRPHTSVYAIDSSLTWRFDK